MKSLIFNTEMVRAILDGRKTQTRRFIPDLVSIRNSYVFNEVCGDGRFEFIHIDDMEDFLMFKPPHKVGDIIYVRETFGVVYSSYEYDDDPRVYYKASPDPYDMHHDVNKWKPSIHMPKEYARLFLRIKDVRIERLNEIEYDDVLAEGFPIDSYEMKQTGKLYSADMHGEVDFEEDRAFEWFTSLWESIYGNGSFDNRYVWVIEFERISKVEAQNDNA